MCVRRRDTKGVKMIHWSAIFIFLVLGLLGLWVAYSFLNKNGLILFSVIAVAFTYMLSGVLFFGNYVVMMSAVLMPLVYFSLIVMYEKYSKDDAKKMFFCLLATFGVFFLSKFLLCAYADSEYGSGTFLTWSELGINVCQIISFALVGFLGNLFVDKFPINKEYKYLRRAVVVTIAGAMDAFLICFLGYIGSLSFVAMLVSFLLYLVFVAGSAFSVAFLRKYLNREPVAPKAEEDKKEEDAEVVEVNVEEEADEPSNKEVEEQVEEPKDDKKGKKKRK